MARYIDANILKEKILEERDKIPLKRVERYSFGVETPYRDGQTMRGGIRKALRCLEQTPTADVAPKSEVERLNKELDELAEEHSDLIVEKDQLFDEVVRLRKALSEYEETSGLKQAKAEVARKIFAELGDLVKCFEIPNGCAIISLSSLAELEKKYTEVKNGTQTIS